MFWQLLGVPTLFDFTELPEYIEFENDKNGVHIRYAQERTCTALLCDNFAESEEGQGEVWVECSECGAELPCGYALTVIANYCPECGAKVVE